MLTRVITCVFLVSVFLPFVLGWIVRHPYFLRFFKVYLDFIRTGTYNLTYLTDSLRFRCFDCEWRQCACVAQHYVFVGPHVCTNSGSAGFLYAFTLSDVTVCVFWIRDNIFKTSFPNQQIRSDRCASHASVL